MVVPAVRTMAAGHVMSGVLRMILRMYRLRVIVMDVRMVLRLFGMIFFRVMVMRIDRAHGRWFY